MHGTIFLAITMYLFILTLMYIYLVCGVVYSNHVSNDNLYIIVNKKFTIYHTYLNKVTGFSFKITFLYLAFPVGAAVSLAKIKAMLILQMPTPKIYIWFCLCKISTHKFPLCEHARNIPRFRSMYVNSKVHIVTEYHGIPV